MNRTNFALIGFCLSFFFLTLDFVQLQFNLGYENSWAAYLDISPLELTIRYLLILAVYISVFTLSHFMFERKMTIPDVAGVIAINRNLTAVNNISLLILSSLAIYILAIIYNYGPLNYMVEVRTGLRSLGGLYYFTTMGLLTSLMCSISVRAKNSIFYFGLLTFTVLVLASGFRNFIVFLIVYWYLSYHLGTRKLVDIKLLTIFLSIVLLFYLFQYYRTDGIVGAYFIDILNRTAPLSQSFVADLNSDLFEPQFIIYNFFLPIITIFSKLGQYDFQNWNEVIVNEAVFRDYLNWRGSYSIRPTGFAINFQIYGYIVAGYIGLLITAITSIYILLIAFLFLKNLRLWNFGLIIICTMFMGIIDSSIESFILMQYIFLYYSFLLFISRVIMKI